MEYQCRVIALFCKTCRNRPVHIGAPKGKMEKGKKEPLENLEPLFRPIGSLKQVRPICSGGLKAPVMWGVS